MLAVARDVPSGRSSRRASVITRSGWSRRCTSARSSWNARRGARGFPPRDADEARTRRRVSRRRHAGPHVPGRGHGCPHRRRARPRRATVQLIREAALLHDVGKVGIPDAILLKAGPLSGEEFDVSNTHPEIGRSILAGSGSDILKCGRGDRGVPPRVVERNRVSYGLAVTDPAHGADRGARGCLRRADALAALQGRLAAREGFRRDPAIARRSSSTLPSWTPSAHRGAVPTEGSREREQPPALVTRHHRRAIGCRAWPPHPACLRSLDDVLPHASGRCGRRHSSSAPTSSRRCSVPSFRARDRSRS